MNNLNESDWLTVAQAAQRLGTTIPRLRRLLARPDLAHCSRREAIPTQRGTRTSTVVLVPEMKSLSAAIQMGNLPTGIQEQKQEHLKTFSKREAAALELALQQTQITLAGKDQTIASMARELAAKDEIIALLKEKITFQEQEQEHGVPVPEKTPPAIEESIQEREQERRVPVPEKRPLSLWDRLRGRQ